MQYAFLCALSKLYRYLLYFEPNSTKLVQYFNVTFDAKNKDAVGFRKKSKW